MKKKIFFAICSLCVCLCICLGFSACKKASDKIAYGTSYNFSTISFMGFTGSRTSILAYIEDPKTHEDNNRFLDYFDLAKELSLKFNEDGTGSVSISGLARFESLENIVDENGVATFDFEYKKDGATITITKVKGNDSYGEDFKNDMTFSEAFNKAVKAANSKNEDSNAEYKIGDSSNILKVENGKIVMNLYVSYKMYKDNYVGSDIATSITVTFEK